jgi:hypothetical protein
VAPTCNSIYSLAWSVLALLHHERVRQKLETGSIRLNIETLALAALALEVFSGSNVGNNEMGVAIEVFCGSP